MSISLSNRTNKSSSAGQTCAPPLSAWLRAVSAPQHKAVEAAAALPQSIQTLADYAACLGRFLSVVAPLEHHLGSFHEWGEAGVQLAARARTPALQADLRAFNVNPDHVPHRHILRPASFAEAFGALYVLEGSTLGGKLILKAAASRLGPAISGAAAFFSGHGEAAGPMWQNFKTALDNFGRTWPAQQVLVAAGAKQTFQHFACALKAPDCG
jgi:heme oxygenase